jgi:hypothetical protein
VTRPSTTGQKHLKLKIRNLVLKVAEKLVSLMARPFAEAPDLQSYSRRGYYLLFLLILIASVLWWLGNLGAPLNQSNVLVQAFYAWLVEKIPVIGKVPQKYIPVAALPALIWAVLLPVKGVRNWLGEATANGCFRVLNRSISMGEWCIEHRWWSLFLILALSSGIAVLMTLQVQRLTRDRTLQSDFYYWLQGVDNFMASNPVTKSEPIAYQSLRSAWRSDFVSLLGRRDGTTHPAVCLHDMLDVLYQESADQPWTVALQMKRERLHKAFERCSAQPMSTSADRLDTRARALVNLLLARVDARLTDDLNIQRYSDYHELVEARDLFQSVADANYSSEEEARPYRADAHNGLGTVYSDALTAYMSSTTLVSGSRAQNLATLCGNPAQCAARSLEEYEDGGRGSAPCAYRSKRQRNNTTDLLIKIGMNYDRLAKSLTGPPFDAWIRTRVSLADQIEQHLRGLMTCNYTESFFSTFATTAAQGLAVSARLRRESGSDGTPQLLAAGYYLRLANSFEPKNVPNWDCSYYCFAVKGGAMEPAFRQAIVSGSDALPSAVGVVQMIEKQCP